MDLEQIMQLVEDSDLVGTSISLRRDQIKAIEKLSGQQRNWKRGWSRTARRALDIGIHVLESTQGKKPTTAK